MTDQPNSPVTHFEHILLERCADLEQRAHDNQLAFEMELKESQLLRQQISELRQQLKKRSFEFVVYSRQTVEMIDAIKLWLAGIIEHQEHVNQAATAIRVLKNVLVSYEYRLPERELLSDGSFITKDDIPF